MPLRNGPGIDLGDRVGVMTRWQWPDAMDGVTLSDVTAVQAAVAAGTWRENVQAGDWVGKPVAEAMGLDLGDPSARARVRGLIKRWIAEGALAIVVRQDENRKERPFVEVGKVAQLPPAPQ